MRRLSVSSGGELIVDAAAPGSSTRVLAILSADYGELFNAMYFAAGTPIRLCLAAPPKVYRANEGALPYATCCYGGVDDLRRAINDFRPDVALLFSGYLYTANKLLPAEGVEQLVDLLDDRGIPVATSDPSLGLLEKPGDGLFAPDHPSRAWMVDHFTQLAGQLNDRTHLYLASEGVQREGKSRSYFNPRFVFSEGDRNRIADKLATEPGFDDKKPFWVYILSPEDDGLQERLHGTEEWTRLIAARLADAVRAGRRAVFLGPAERRRTVGEHLANEAPEVQAGVTMLKACRYPLFIQLLITAEHAFYWNRFSASILARLINRLSTFSFETGHLAAAMPAVEAVAEQHFYAGCDWPTLDLCEPLEADALNEQAEQQQSKLFGPVIANLSRASDSAEVIAELAQQGARIAGGGMP